jgi:hypothetical protein
MIVSIISIENKLNHSSVADFRRPRPPMSRGDNDDTVQHLRVCFNFTQEEL